MDTLLLHGGKKKPTAKKQTAKKSTAKKPTAKKSTAKKPTAKKPTAKKSTTKKGGNVPVQLREWSKFLKRVVDESGLPYREAMTLASDLYRKAKKRAGCSAHAIAGSAHTIAGRSGKTSKRGRGVFSSVGQVIDDLI